MLSGRSDPGPMWPIAAGTALHKRVTQEQEKQALRLAQVGDDHARAPSTPRSLPMFTNRYIQQVATTNATHRLKRIGYAIRAYTLEVFVADGAGDAVHRARIVGRNALDHNHADVVEYLRRGGRWSSGGF